MLRNQHNPVSTKSGEFQVSTNMHMNKQQIEELMKRVKDNSDAQKVHTPYNETTGRLPDFEVQYKIHDEVTSNFTQGARCDFLYEGDDPKTDGIHMIWPEFLDDNGEVILDKTIHPKKQGRATMWIGMHESRVKFHRPRLKVGTKGYWVVGSKKIANVEVTKILGVFENKE